MIPEKQSLPDAKFLLASIPLSKKTYLTTELTRPIPPAIDGPRLRQIRRSYTLSKQIFWSTKKRMNQVADSGD